MIKKREKRKSFWSLPRRERERGSASLLRNWCDNKNCTKWKTILHLKHVSKLFLLFDREKKKYWYILLVLNERDICGDRLHEAHRHAFTFIRAPAKKIIKQKKISLFFRPDQTESLQHYSFDIEIMCIFLLFSFFVCHPSLSWLSYRIA